MTTITEALEAVTDVPLGEISADAVTDVVRRFADKEWPIAATSRTARALG